MTVQRPPRLRPPAAPGQALGPTTSARDATNAAAAQAAKHGIGPAELERVLRSPVFGQGEVAAARRLIQQLRADATELAPRGQAGTERLANALHAEVSHQPRLAAAKASFEAGDLSPKLFARLTEVPSVGVRGLVGLGRLHFVTTRERDQARAGGEHKTAQALSQRLERLDAINTQLNGAMMRPAELGGMFGGVIGSVIATVTSTIGVDALLPEATNTVGIATTIIVGLATHEALGDLDAHLGSQHPPHR